MNTTERYEPSGLTIHPGGYSVDGLYPQLFSPVIVPSQYQSPKYENTALANIQFDSRMERFAAHVPVTDVIHDTPVVNFGTIEFDVTRDTMTYDVSSYDILLRPQEKDIPLSVFETIAEQ